MAKSDPHDEVRTRGEVQILVTRYDTRGTGTVRADFKVKIRKMCFKTRANCRPFLFSDYGTVKAGNVVTFGAQNNFFLRISFM